MEFLAWGFQSQRHISSLTDVNPISMLGQALSWAKDTALKKTGIGPTLVLEKARKTGWGEDSGTHSEGFWQISEDSFWLRKQRGRGKKSEAGSS